MYYIENTVDEYRGKIVGYFQTFQEARAALRKCSDWYRENGTGKIYQVSFGLNQTPKLIYEGKGNKEDGEIFDINEKNLLMFLDEIRDKVAEMPHGTKKDKYAAEAISIRYRAQKGGIVDAWAMLLMGDMFRELIGNWESVSTNLCTPAKIKIISNKS